MKEIKIKTKSGYKTAINPRIIEDWDFLEIIANADSEDVREQLNATIKLINILFKDKKNDYMAFLREHNDGIADVDIIKDDVVGIIEEVKVLKNSSSSEE